jgi:hypothetical protein
MRSIVAMGKGGLFCLQTRRLNQASQLRTRHNKIHSFKKITLSCSHDDQFKSGRGEGGLFHEDITFKSGVTMIFTDIP